LESRVVGFGELVVKAEDKVEEARVTECFGEGVWVLFMFNDEVEGEDHSIEGGE
jgi:hypothetical protein